jgi:hypothetical protein
VLEQRVDSIGKKKDKQKTEIRSPVTSKSMLLKILRTCQTKRYICKHQTKGTLGDCNQNPHGTKLQYNNPLRMYKSD